MFTKTVSYTDFNDQPQTETFHFHLSKPELLDLKFSTPEGSKTDFEGLLKSVIDTKDQGALITLFKQLVLDSYGQKSADGKRFIKSPELRLEFSQTAAYQELFMQLATDDNEAITFMKALLPKDLQNQISDADVAKAKAGMGKIVEAVDPSVIVAVEPTKKDPKDMTREELLAAFRERNAGM